MPHSSSLPLQSRVSISKESERDPREKTLTFADLVAEPDLDSKKLEVWLDGKEEGVHFAPFNGEPRELAFIKKHIRGMFSASTNTNKLRYN
jgi:hypothetical protein